jgi:putative (di)nucleoside polyphosphate hydrolase
MKIRKAVCAIVEKENKFLLVHKVKIMDSKSGAEKIKGEWDFSKGGVKPFETDIKEAVLRELKEETGSTKYKIIKEFEEKIKFDFPQNIKEKIGFDGQETTVFLLQYLGDGSEIKPQDEEIDLIKFIEKDMVLEKLAHEEMKDFFKRNIML